MANIESSMILVQKPKIQILGEWYETKVRNQINLDCWSVHFAARSLWNCMRERY